MSITKDTDNSTAYSICPECRKSKETKTSSEVETETEGKNAKESWFDKEKALKYTKWGGVAVAGACAVPMVVGFSTAGIAAGSIAAAWQASIGNVAAGSAFATLQSLGATGVFAAGAGTGATATTGAFVAEKVSKKKHSEGNQGDEADKEGGTEECDEPETMSQDQEHEAKNVAKEEYKCEKCGKVFYEDVQYQTVSQ
ncbi:hypothetical protein CTEN210_12409 [Chaetoceros tenuissimus]|uniref:Uncharacterized protein n=1 Tax=Chaetoceros tenuissimus TaxID=426638 RepID=A0AAD3D1F6_9STRA|nr:hypothetical protein CTEN210_12409 [Chaetoceros tenuissimus]